MNLSIIKVTYMPSKRGFMKFKNSIFVALLVIGFSSSASAESVNITEELKQLRRLNEASAHECDQTVEAVVKSAKEYLSEKAATGSEGNVEISDTLHAIEIQCENNKNS